MYTEYEGRMKAADALDFEDLLLRGTELFRQEPWVLKSVKHIFVDEFQVSQTCFCRADLKVDIRTDTRRVSNYRLVTQDTNVTQYGLLR